MYFSLTLLIRTCWTSCLLVNIQKYIRLCPLISWKERHCHLNIQKVCQLLRPIKPLGFLLLYIDAIPPFFFPQQKISWSFVATCSEGLLTPRSRPCMNMSNLLETSSPWIMVSGRTLHPRRRSFLLLSAASAPRQCLTVPRTVLKGWSSDRFSLPLKRECVS